ncbi:MAG: hypothetical protein WC979_00375 [Candidatus Pacearchaeota archaeon]|jgi:hypothetical protein|nr:hypothetical protein [Clostridia bacterium]
MDPEQYEKLREYVMLDIKFTEEFYKRWDNIAIENEAIKPSSNNILLICN